MKKIFLAISMAFTLMVGVAAVSSCGSGNNAKSEEEEKAALEEVIKETSDAKSGKDVDSLALMADDLTEEEAVQVLATYVQRVNDAKDAGAFSRRLEAMRKFVDVYDIVMSANGKGMRKKFEGMKGRVDMVALSELYRRELTDLASGSATDGVDLDPEDDVQETRIDTIVSSAAEAV